MYYSQFEDLVLIDILINPNRSLRVFYGQGDRTRDRRAEFYRYTRRAIAIEILRL
jgi:hypothetical protein